MTPWTRVSWAFPLQADDPITIRPPRHEGPSYKVTLGKSVASLRSLQVDIAQLSTYIVGMPDMGKSNLMARLFLENQDHSKILIDLQGKLTNELILPNIQDPSRLIYFAPYDQRQRPLGCQIAHVGSRAFARDKVIRNRVEAARERQRRRFAGYVDGHSQLLTNADTPALRAGASVGPGEIREFCPVDEAGHSLLRAATPARAAARRAGARVADLIGAAPSAIAPGCFAKRIETAHLVEAIHLRPAALAGVRVAWRAWRANPW